MEPDALKEKLIRYTLWLPPVLFVNCDDSRVMDSKWGGRTESVDVKLNTEQVNKLLAEM